jgi:hypothetical protein
MFYDYNIKIGKMRSVETIPEWGEGGIMESGGGGEFSMIYFIYCQNFCKCHNVPPTQHNSKIYIYIHTEQKDKRECITWLHGYIWLKWLDFSFTFCLFLDFMVKLMKSM